MGWTRSSFRQFEFGHFRLVLCLHVNLKNKAQDHLRPTARFFNEQLDDVTLFAFVRPYAPHLANRPAWAIASTIRCLAGIKPRPPNKQAASLNAVTASVRQASETKRVGTGCQE